MQRAQYPDSVCGRDEASPVSPSKSEVSLTIIFNIYGSNVHFGVRGFSIKDRHGVDFTDFDTQVTRNATNDGYSA